MRLDSDTLATRDIDLRWDTRKRILFSTQLARVDSTFHIRKSQRYTTVNKDGFEVDISRRKDVLQAEAVQELLDRYLPPI